MAQEYQIVQKLREHLKELIRMPEDCTPSPDRIFDAVVASVITASHLILQGPPGIAKTTLVKLVAKAFGLESGMWKINGTLGTKEEDLVAGLDLVALANHERKVFWSEFVDAPIRLLDEANRINEFATSPLLPLLGENEARFGGVEMRKIPRRFTAFTLNPPEPGEGNFNLTKPLRDRMDLEVFIPDIGFEEMESILEANEAANGDLVSAMPILGTIADLEAIQAKVAAITVNPEVNTAIGLYIEATKICKKRAKETLVNFPACCSDCEMANSTFPCSKVTPLMPRAGISAKNLAKGIAFMRRSAQVEKKDVDAVFPFVMSHRVKFPNQQIENMREYVFKFFSVLESETRFSFNILTNPVNESEDKMANAKSKMFEKNGNPLIKKVMTLQRTKLKIGEAGKRLKEKLIGMNASELAKTKSKSGLSMEERNLVSQMITARNQVHFEVESQDVLTDQSFRDLFTVSSGDPFFTEDAWEDVAWEGEVAQPHSKLVGVDMGFMDNVLSLDFGDNANEADTFTERMRQVKGSFTILCPYEKAGLSPQLEKAGIIKPKTETEQEEGVAA